MQVSPKWFEDNGYKLHEVLYHQDLIPFVKNYILKKNIFTFGYLFLNLLFLLLLLTRIIFSLANFQLDFSNTFTFLGFGCALTFLLIPIHEGLHGIAYKMCGAPTVTFAANWKKMYFMAIADKFPIGRKPFLFVGLAPFVIISLLFIFLAATGSPQFQIMYFTVLLVHASMCIGDFALMSYFSEQGDKEVITFDDYENSLTYFYSK
ncbi:MAG: DUF3267 domain-containing protein [Bacteroidetes bacterium]|nr:DUF3267 domain-containing protein [Bacteroidota bacterium]